MERLSEGVASGIAELTEQIHDLTAKLDLLTQEVHAATRGRRRGAT
jgi:hypothetical protein